MQDMIVVEIYSVSTVMRFHIGTGLVTVVKHEYDIAMAREVTVEARVHCAVC